MFRHALRSVAVLGALLASVLLIRAVPASPAAEGQWAGRLERWIEDDLAAGRSRQLQFLNTGQGAVEVSFGRGVPKPAAGEWVRLHGEATAQHLEVTSWQSDADRW